jgi:hypothetical protein
MLQQRRDRTFKRCGDEISGYQQTSIRIHLLKCPQQDGKTFRLALVSESSDQQRGRS